MEQTEDHRLREKEKSIDVMSFLRGIFHKDIARSSHEIFFLFRSLLASSEDRLRTRVSNPQVRQKEEKKRRERGTDSSYKERPLITNSRHPIDLSLRYLPAGEGGNSSSLPEREVGLLSLTRSWGRREKTRKEGVILTSFRSRRGLNFFPGLLSFHLREHFLILSSSR